MKQLFSFVGKILLATIGIALPILALEIIIRVLGMAPPPIPNPNIWQSDAVLGWTHLPNSGGTFYSSYNEYQTDVQINAVGMRDDLDLTAYQLPDDELSVMILADSFGESLQVPIEKTFFKNIQRKLTENGIPAQTLNTGVGSYGTDQEVTYFREEGHKFNPDLTLLFFFVRNDTVNSYAPLEIARNGGSIQKSFYHLDDAGSLVYPAPFDSETAYETYGVEKPKPLPHAPLARTADWLYLHSDLYRFSVPYLTDMPAVLHAVGASGILGGEARVRVAHPAVPVPFYVYQNPLTHEWQSAWALIDALIADLQSQVEANGSQLAVILIPAKEQVYPEQWSKILAANADMQNSSWDLEMPNRQMENILTKHKIPHLDLLPIFEQAAQNAPDTALYFVHDWHWSEAGHALAGESVFQFLMDENLAQK